MAKSTPRTVPTDVPVATFLASVDDPARRADCETLVGLIRHKTGKSGLYLKRLADVDLDVLRQLIEASVAAMAPQRVFPSKKEVKP